MELSNLRLRLFTYFIMGYMMLAFVWWSVLLFTKNHDAFHAKTDNMRLYKIAKKEYIDESNFTQLPDYIELKNKYARQEWMIFGEATVFILTLMYGIWQINNSYNREITAAQQRRNFLLSITHELKSPISSIQLILETFQKRQLEQTQILKLTNSGLQEAERLNALVNDLLLSAKLETAYQPNFETIDLHELLHELVAKLQVKNPNVHFQIDAPDELPYIQADLSGMTSVIQNLLENAIKYSEEPIQIKINQKVIGNDLVMQFADNGLGIPDKEKKKVFEKFYRIGNEDTRKTKGTGLGLYIVSQIIKAHQGKIQIRNNVPKGSVFVISLPIIKV